MTNKAVIGGIEVFGVEVDAETRCHHYHSEIDRLAIKFPCCGQYYSCFECHQELASHPSSVWGVNDFERKAVLCGACGTELTINEYRLGGSTCLHCKSPFNSGCKSHWHLYFERGPE